MQNSIAMNSDIKALLTLWLLKTGTNAQEIHTALQVAAASRVMVAEENAGPSRDEAELTPNNVAKFRPASEALAVARKQRQQADAMNSDIKALLTLSLLKIGATSNEIQTALRLAAASRAAASEERSELMRAETPVQPEPIAETALSAASVGPVPAAVNDSAPAPATASASASASAPSSVKQSVRNDQLAPISIHEFAAA